MLAMRRTIGLALIAASLHCPPANADGDIACEMYRTGPSCQVTSRVCKTANR